MEGIDIFRPTFGSGLPPTQSFPPRKPPQPHHRAGGGGSGGGDDEDESGPHRIAHTLTACCRCRQRKTRCDPTLPRCLPCERSGSTCEYFDTTKGKKISRFYVVKLQEKVRQLESELAQYTEEDNFPKSSEDIVRVGGFVRLNDSDETPRYLGPSSGIAMTRLLMEEAKRYTDTKRISELIPEVRARRIDRVNRMQSVSFGNSISGPSGRRKSYPMLSAHPAQTLTTRPIADKLVEVFNTRAQVFYPTLHEAVFAKDVDHVFSGSTDPYKNFVVRMVMAISLQKLDTQYAGLADSYYLAAMQHFENVIRSKDLKTLQCLVLIGQYSLLTPTRTNVYHIIGLATRICQQLGYGDEKTLASAAALVDPLTLDMRRRLSWVVTEMEFSLAHCMGRPNGFAKGDDLMDVGFFSEMDDADITEQGIQDGPPSEKKLVAIHNCKMRLCEAEIRRVLYESSAPEPRNDSHPWFAQMEQKIKDWLDQGPEQPAWCKPWFTGHYHTMVVFMFRPTPKVPRPSAAAALKCYDSAEYIINLGSQQVKKAAIDITWVFLLTMYLSLNAVIWSASYPEVRQEHLREKMEELVHTALDVLDQCAERWPGASGASQLYAVLARTCMQSYDAKGEPSDAAPDFDRSPSYMDSDSPSASDISQPPSASSLPQNNSQVPMFTTPQFGYVFAPSEPVSAPFTGYESPFQQNAHPQFRSGSIFFNPGSMDGTGRRLSYFPPDAPPQDNTALEEGPQSNTTTPQQNSNQLSPPVPSHLPTPPESSIAGSAAHPPSALSPTSTLMGAASPTPTMPHASPLPVGASPVPVPPIKFEPGQSPQSHPTPMQTPAQPAQRATPTFTIPPLPQHHHQQQQQHPHHHQPGGGGAPQQRPLPTTVADWFSPPPPIISPHSFSGMGGPGGAAAAAAAAHAAAVNGGAGFFPDPSSTFSTLGLSGNGGGMGGLPGFAGHQFGFPGNHERIGSLSQEQQMELMDVLETDGLGEIDAFLSMGIGLGGGGVDGGVQWHQ